VLRRRHTVEDPQPHRLPPPCVSAKVSAPMSSFRTAVPRIGRSATPALALLRGLLLLCPAHS